MIFSCHSPPATRVHGGSMRSSVSTCLYVSLIVLLAGIPSFSATKFKDIPDDHWASRSVYNMVRLGVTRGYPDGTFRGDEKISRYQLMVYMSNLEIAMEKMMDEKMANAPGSEDSGTGATLNRVVEELKAEVDSLRASLIEYQQAQGVTVTGRRAEKNSGIMWGQWLVTGDYTFRANSYRVSGDEITTDYISQRARLTIGKIGPDAGALFELDTGYVNPSYQGLAANVTSTMLAVEAWAQTGTFWEGTLRVDASGGPGDIELNDYPANGVVTRCGTIVYRPGNAVKASWKFFDIEISERYEKRAGNVDRATGMLGYTMDLGAWNLGTFSLAMGGESYSIADAECPTNSRRSLAEARFTPFPALTVYGKGAWMYARATEEFEYFSESGFTYVLERTDTLFRGQVDRISQGFYSDNVADEVAATDIMGRRILPSFEVAGGSVTQYFLGRTLFLSAQNSVATCMLNDRDAMHLYQENTAQFEGGWYISSSVALTILGRNSEYQLYNDPQELDLLVDHIISGQFSIQF